MSFRKCSNMLTLIALIALAALGCGDSSKGSVSSETHFVSCGKQSDCVPHGSALACVSGQCVQAANTLEFTGIVTGSPYGGGVVTGWASPDRNARQGFYFGNGSATPPSFSVNYPEPPPAEAFVTPGLAVGSVLHMMDDPIPSGLAEPFPGPLAAYGASYRHLVVFRAGADDVPPPLAAFPVGYSCAECVALTPGIDPFEPVECSRVELRVVFDAPDPWLEPCNWR